MGLNFPLNHSYNHSFMRRAAPAKMRFSQLAPPPPPRIFSLSLEDVQVKVLVIQSCSTASRTCQLTGQSIIMQARNSHA
jgi:hypothetical protein